MLAKSLTGLVMIGSASAVGAQAQNSTTNCYAMGASVQCNTNTTTTPPPPTVDWGAINRQQQAISQQNQQNVNQSFSNLGSAIAVDRERRKVKRIENEIADANARDTDPTPTLPPAETPVLLACTFEQSGFNVTLYPKSGRADVTSNGRTKMRAATFTQDLVTWSSPTSRTSISRVDLSTTSVALLPSMNGLQWAGSCALADRKF